jgi:hypothetical protein
MKIIKMTEDAVYDHLDEPFNPPAINESFTEDDFSAEWHGVRNRFEDLLAKFGENDAYGNKDFNLGETLTLSRGIGVELTSQKMLNRELIPETQRFLETLPHEYEIDFAVMSEEGIHHVFVNRSVVQHGCPRSIFKRFV